MQFRILELLMFTAFVGGAFAVMRSPDYLNSCVYACLIILTMLLALVLAITTRGPSQWYWISFAVCGFLYVGFAQLYYVGVPPTDQRENLVTSTILDRVFERTHGYEDGASPPPFGGGGGGFGGGGGGGLGSALKLGNILSDDQLEEYRGFMHTGHCLIAICLAWMGGHFGLIVSRRKAE